MRQHPYDQIEALTLGDLEPAEAHAILEHADACPTCAVLVADAMTGVSALSELETPRWPARPAPVLTLSRRVVPSAWVGALATAAACVALLWWNLDLRSSQPVVPIAALVHSHFIHHALRGPAGAGSAKVIQATDGSWLYVVGDGLTPRGRYALWERSGGALSDVGEFVTDGSGNASAFWRQTPRSIEGLIVSAAGIDAQRIDAHTQQTLRWP